MAARNSNYSTEGLIPFDEPLSKEFLMKKAKAELNETEENREKGLEQIRALIKEHKVRCITTDEFLLRFLRTKKFQIQRSFEAVRIYSQERAAADHFISNLRPEILEACLRNKIFGILPYRDFNGRLTGYINTGNWDESICKDEEIIFYGFVPISYGVADESVQINGAHILIEEGNFRLRNALIGINHLYIRRNFLFKSAPVRYQRIDVMNEPMPARYLYPLVKPFLPQKIKNRIFFHGQARDELFKHIPQCCLEPESESSTDDPFINNKAIEILKEYVHKVKEEQLYFISERR